MQPDPLSGRRGIFVLGLQRSGTTWIANMLHGSGAVAAIAAEDHRGVHESLFFSHFARLFAPLSNPDMRAAFLEAFQASDYWILSGLPDRFLEGIVASATDHGAVFEAMMDTVADRQGAPFWLEKSPHHSLLSEALAERFPAARFVCVVRDSRSLIVSRLSAYGRTPPTGLRRIADILRGALANAQYTRHLRRFAAGNPRAHLVHYDSFVADPAISRAALVRTLRLPVPPEALVSRFAPNTSHDRDPSTRRLSPLDGMTLALGEVLGRSLPLALLGRLESRRRKSRGAAWPEWVWRRSGFMP